MRTMSMSRSLLVFPCVLAVLSGCSRPKASPAAAGEESAVSAAATATAMPAAPPPVATAPALATPPAADPAPASASAHGGSFESSAKSARPSSTSVVRAPSVAPSPAAEKPSLGSVEGRFDRRRAPSATPVPAPAFGTPFDAFAQGASSVKAGEWDDNANYREFQRFLAVNREGFHRVDLRDRRFLVVRDSKGRAVPRCRVNVSDGAQAQTSFVTTASGRAILFPRAEGLREGKLTAIASCEGTTTQATFAVGPNDPDAVVDLTLQAERRPLATRMIDVAFVLDTTGSMSEEIAAVKSTIQKVAGALSSQQTQVRIGLVEYKDRTDPFVTKVYPFSTDLVGFSSTVSQISAGGGGDTPEDMNAGLHSALTELSWNDQAVARLAFVIADAPPHLDYQGPDYAQDMKKASHRGIQLFTVAASGMDGLGQVVFRQMAQFTGGTNMFVLRGGAGPQSTGGGDPGSSCGGTHTNYSSGKLDELIVTKIRRELKAIDGDPMRIAGLKTDENAKPCNERIAWND